MASRDDLYNLLDNLIKFLAPAVDHDDYHDCPSCDYDYPSTYNYCPNCGFKRTDLVDTGDFHDARTEPDEPEYLDTKCYKCHTKYNRDTYRDCPTCKGYNKPRITATTADLCTCRSCGYVYTYNINAYCPRCGYPTFDNQPGTGLDGAKSATEWRKRRAKKGL